MIKAQKIIKLHLTFLFVASLMFALPAHAGKFKFLITPGSLVTLFGEANSATFESDEISFAGGDIDRLTYDGKEGTSDISFTLDLGKGPDKTAIDYYSIASIYKHSQNNINRELRASGKGLMLGYRRQTPSGFYVGGGIMLVYPSVERKDELSGSGLNVGLSSSYTSPNTTNYNTITPLTLTLGYDHSYDNGLVLGVHVMRTAANKLVNNGRDTGIDDFYLQSISFGIGYKWN